MSNLLIPALEKNPVKNKQHQQQKLNNENTTTTMTMYMQKREIWLHSFIFIISFFNEWIFFFLENFPRIMNQTYHYNNNIINTCQKASNLITYWVMVSNGFSRNKKIDQRRLSVKKFSLCFLTVTIKVNKIIKWYIQLILHFILFNLKSKGILRNLFSTNYRIAVNKLTWGCEKKF